MRASNEPEDIAKLARYQKQSDDDLQRYYRKKAEYDRLVKNKIIPETKEQLTSSDLLDRWAMERFSDPDNVTDTPYARATVFDHDAQVTRVLNAIFCYRYITLGLLLGMGPLTLFEFIMLAPNHALYFGGTKHEVSKHAIEC